jgi:DNA-binding transcriptional LysR family regulator
MKRGRYCIRFSRVFGGCGRSLSCAVRRLGLSTEFTLSAEAERLVEPVRGILSLVELTIEQRPEFDPGTNTRAFSISASDCATLVLLSTFVRAVAAETPGVTIYTLHMVSCAPTT